MTLLCRPLRRTVSLSLLLLLAPSAALAQSGQKPVPKPAPPPDPLVRMNESIDALTKKVWPSVVQILVSSYGAQPEGPRGQHDARRRQTTVRRIGIRRRS